MPKVKNNPVSLYDFTIPKDVEYNIICTELRKWCKKWIFQEEKSESGYVHYQGKMSLIKKRRLGEIAKKWKDIPALAKAHLSISHDTSFDYVTKEDTRVAGPWSNENTHGWRAWHIEKITKLYPWQQKIVDEAKERNERTINVIYDQEGCKGKSTLGLYMLFHGLGRLLPLFNDHKDLMRAVMNMPKATCYLIDFPRAYEGKRMHMMWAGIESIKNGYVYDDRYEFKEMIFGSPNVWVFCNKLPNQKLVSRDRWKIWKITDQMELAEYDPEDNI